MTERRHGPDRRTVTARFTNCGRPDEVRFLFVREGGRWYLDDAIEGTGSGDGGLDALGAAPGTRGISGRWLAWPDWRWRSLPALPST